MVKTNEKKIVKYEEGITHKIISLYNFYWYVSEPKKISTKTRIKVLGRRQIILKVNSHCSLLHFAKKRIKISFNKKKNILFVNNLHDSTAKRKID